MVVIFIGTSLFLYYRLETLKREKLSPLYAATDTSEQDQTLQLFNGSQEHPSSLERDQITQSRLEEQAYPRTIGTLKVENIIIGRGSSGTIVFKVRMTLPSTIFALCLALIVFYRVNMMVERLP